MSDLSGLITRFKLYIISPTILIIFSAGFFLFVWGLVEFLRNLNAGGDNKEGKQHMVWGLVGMLVMVSVYGIISLIDNTFSLNILNPDVSRINNVIAPVNFLGN